LGGLKVKRFKVGRSEEGFLRTKRGEAEGSHSFEMTGGGGKKSRSLAALGMTVVEEGMTGGRRGE
jgi:hypothetical protein